MDIADKIKFLRVNVAQLSQNSFASKINVTRNTIKNWESGASKPTVSHIVLISLLCDVSTDYLIFDNCPYELSLNGLSNDDYKLLSDLIERLLKKKEIKSEREYYL